MGAKSDNTMLLSDLFLPLPIDPMQASKGRTENSHASSLYSPVPSAKKRSSPEGIITTRPFLYRPITSWSSPAVLGPATWSKQPLISPFSCSL
jgi:hypothetical protein